MLTVQTLNHDIEKQESTAGEIRACVSSVEAKRIWERLAVLQVRRTETEDRLYSLIQMLEEQQDWPQVYEMRYDRFMKWAASMEQRLLHKQRALLDDVVKRLSGPLREELNTKEKEPVWLITKGQELSNICTERKEEVLEKVRNVEEIWKRLQDIWKRELERLQQLPTDMEDLNNSLAELTVWFSQVEATLNAPLTVAHCSKEAVDDKLTEHQELETSIENKSQVVSSVMNLCESFTTNFALRDGWLGTDLEGVQSAMQSLERRWKAICQAAASREVQLQSLWTDWAIVLDLCAELDGILSDIDQSVPEDVATPTTVEVEQLYSQLEATIHQLHAPSTRQKLDHLNEKYCNLARDGRVDAAGELQQRICSVNTRWRELSDRLSARLQSSRDASTLIQHWQVGTSIHFHSKWRNNYIRFLDGYFLDAGLA